MKKISLILFFVVISLLTTVFAQSYRVLSRGVECYYNGKWKTIPKDYVLRGSFVVRSNDCFKVNNTKTNKGYCCAPSIKGDKLVELIKKKCPYADRIGSGLDSVVTHVPMGKDLEKIAIRQSTEIFPANFHYLLVGVHDFQDRTAWKQLPDPTNNIKDLEKAIEKMRKENQFQKSTHEMIVTSNETSRDAILEKLRRLSDDSVKNHNNDMVFLYFSSHGDLSANKFNFITTDSQISADTINSYINKMTAKGAKVLAFIDACWAGKIVEEINAIDGDGKCVYYMSSADNKESYATGAFVRALTCSTSGEALDFNKYCSTNIVNPGVLYNYITHVVTEENKGQTPRFKLLNFKEGDPLWVVNPTRIDTLKDQANDTGYCSMCANLKLGDIYYNSYQKHGVNKDIPKALEYYRKAREEGNPMASCRLGMHYYYQSPTPDYEQAFELFKESADKDCDLGRYYLSVCYAKGRGVKQNNAKAKHYFKIINYWNEDLKQAYSKEKVVFITTSIHRMLNQPSTVIALKWINGDTIVNKEDIRAETVVETYSSLLSKANKGDSKSQAKIGEWWLYGKDRGRRDYQEAYKWYHKSAEQGDKDGLYGMGILCMNGLGVEKNFQKAEEYLQQSGAKGVSKAYTKLGILYYSGGYGLEADTNLAIELWQKAVKLNDVEGMYELGKCYKEGIGGLPKDTEKAIYLFKKCAKKGHLASCYYVGELLGDKASEETKQKEKWTRESNKWLKRAIKRGNRKALEFYNIKFNNACPSENL